MRTTHTLRGAGLTLALLSTLNSKRSTLIAQGRLTPPGAPGTNTTTAVEQAVPAAFFRVEAKLSLQP